MVAERLKKCRKYKNVTQREVAEQIGVTVSSYQKYELSARDPSYEILIKLADYFDVTTDYLLGRTDTF